MTKEELIIIRSSVKLKDLLKETCKELNVSMSKFITIAIIEKLSRIDKKNQDYLLF